MEGRLTVGFCYVSDRLRSPNPSIFFVPYDSAMLAMIFVIRRVLPLKTIYANWKSGIALGVFRGQKSIGNTPDAQNF